MRTGFRRGDPRLGKGLRRSTGYPPRQHDLPMTHLRLGLARLSNA